uniref:Cadherin N-terminal domain-containing protein n=1 Tax=Amphilophus citrinellus TaxID=61819 RepID=A0A3Q0RCX7_AMPCI
MRTTKRMGYRDWGWLALWWHHFFLLWSTINGQTRYSIPEELKRGSVVGNIAKDLGLGLDFTLIKPSSTTDFKEVISVLDASLPDSTWTFESQQVSRKQQTFT